MLLRRVLVAGFRHHGQRIHVEERVLRHIHARQAGVVQRPLHHVAVPAVALRLKQRPCRKDQRDGRAGFRIRRVVRQVIVQRERLADAGGAHAAGHVHALLRRVEEQYKYGRKVVVEGRSMVNIIGIASELGYINIPDNTLIDIEELKNYPDEKTVMITPGSQGESMAALSRMACGMHKKVTIKPNDTIVLSSNPIPGNEKAVSGIINELSMKGANVIFQDVHVSGHACQEEIKLIYSLVKPKYAVPVHGEYRHLLAQARVAEELGINKDNIFILTSGDVLELDDEKAEVTGRVHVGDIMVDGLGVGDVGNIVLRDRQHLAEDGIIIVVLTLESGSGQVLAGPDIVSRGFVYVRGAESLMEDAKHLLEDKMQYCMDKGITDWGKIKNEIKDSLGDFVWKETKRRPMIMPIIMEV